MYHASRCKHKAQRPLYNNMTKEPNIPTREEQHGRREKNNIPRGRHEKHDVNQREREGAIGYSAHHREPDTNSQLREQQGPQVPTKTSEDQGQESDQEQGTGTPQRTGATANQGDAGGRTDGARDIRGGTKTKTKEGQDDANRTETYINKSDHNGRRRSYRNQRQRANQE